MLMPVHDVLDKNRQSSKPTLSGPRDPGANLRGATEITRHSGLDLTQKQRKPDSSATHAEVQTGNPSYKSSVIQVNACMVTRTNEASGKAVFLSHVGGKNVLFSSIQKADKGKKSF